MCCTLGCCLVYKVKGTKQRGGDMNIMNWIDILFMTAYADWNDEIGAPGASQTMQNAQDTEDVITLYGNMVYRLAFAKVQNRHDADDIYQDVFLRYVRRAPQFESYDHGKAWFLRTTINCCKNLWASAWQRKTTGLSEVGDEAVTYPSEDTQLLAEALAQLSDKYRVVLYLYYYEGLTAEEIGKLQSIPAGTARMQLSRGRAMLKELLLHDTWAQENNGEGGGKYD